jgi:hypothetical protein
MNIPEKLVTLGTQDTGRRPAKQINVRENRRAIKNGLSRATGNIGYTRYRTQTNRTQKSKNENIQNLYVQVM